MIKGTMAVIVGIMVIGTGFLGVEWAYAQPFQTCVSSGAVKAYIECSGAFLDQHGAAVTAVAMIIIAAFTGTLWGVTTRSNKLTRESLAAGRRAFVFALGLNGFWERDEATGQYNWRFRPLWQNSGDTPSKNLRFYTGCELRDAPLPSSFRFDGGAAGIGLIPPKATLSGGIAPEQLQAAITPQDILQVQAGRKFLYVWGWARYRDVFPGSKEHITHFCWLVTPVGDPLAYVPGAQPPAPGGLVFHTTHHTEGNCADEDCG